MVVCENMVFITVPTHHHAGGRERRRSIDPATHFSDEKEWAAFETDLGTTLSKDKQGHGPVHSNEYSQDINLGSDVDLGANLTDDEEFESVPINNSEMNDDRATLKRMKKLLPWKLSKATRKILTESAEQEQQSDDEEDMSFRSDNLHDRRGSIAVSTVRSAPERRRTKGRRKSSSNTTSDGKKSARRKKEKKEKTSKASRRKAKSSTTTDEEEDEEEDTDDQGFLGFGYVPLGDSGDDELCVPFGSK